MTTRRRAEDDESTHLMKKKLRKKVKFEEVKEDDFGFNNDGAFDLEVQMQLEKSRLSFKPTTHSQKPVAKSKSKKLKTDGYGSSDSESNANDNDDIFAEPKAAKVFLEKIEGQEQDPEDTFIEVHDELGNKEVAVEPFHLRMEMDEGSVAAQVFQLFII